MVVERQTKRTRRLFPTKPTFKPGREPRTEDWMDWATTGPHQRGARDYSTTRLRTISHERLCSSTTEVATTATEYVPETSNVT